jgi:alcohol dehydrogenase (cytochrome c)
MNIREGAFASAAGTVVGLALFAGMTVGAFAQGGDDPNNWSWYHGNSDATRYSPLGQINRDNVADLKVAWIHQPGAIEQGLEATPLAIDGVIYYTGSYNRVFALDGATGKELWHYYADIDPIIEETFHQPFSRGVGAGHGNIYVGTLDGHGIALDMKTGKEIWNVVLLDTAKCSCNFTSPPVVAKDKVVFGPTAGEFPINGHIHAVNASDGSIAWQFNTIKQDLASWAGESMNHGGGGGWMPGTYDASTNTLFWGTGNPVPDYDWGQARDGDNLYTSSVLAFNPDTGDLKWYHQEIPHDDWDYDSALGEFWFLDRDDKKLVVHQNKSGYVFVYERESGTIENIWNMNENSTWVESIDPKTGELIGRNPPRLDNSPHKSCPWIAGGRSWNSGSYSPKTNLWYNTAMEACLIVEVKKQTPVKEPMAQAWFGADIVAAHPDGEEAHGRLDARDPVTGERTWSVRYKYPPIASVLSTAGGLVFHGDIEGNAMAYDADSGERLWSFNTGSGIRGGTISYSAGGDQYILVPSGLGSLVMGLYPALWPEVADFPAGAALIAFKLP